MKEEKEVRRRSKHDHEELPLVRKTQIIFSRVIMFSVKCLEIDIFSSNENHRCKVFEKYCEVYQEKFSIFTDRLIISPSKNVHVAISQRIKSV